MSTKKTKNELTASGSSRAKDRVDTERPQSGRGIKKPPEYLTDEETKIWDRLLPKALEMKTYKNADHDSFAQLCRSLNTLLTVQKKLIEVGFVSETTYEIGQGKERQTVTATKESPLFLTEKRCIHNYNTFAAQFGFNPMARTRLQITPYQKGAAIQPAPNSPDPDDDGKPPNHKILEMMNINRTA